MQRDVGIKNPFRKSDVGHRYGRVDFRVDLGLSVLPPRGKGRQGYAFPRGSVRMRVKNRTGKCKGTWELKIHFASQTLDIVAGGSTSTSTWAYPCFRSRWNSTLP